MLPATMVSTQVKVPPDEQSEGSLPLGSMVSAYRIDALVGTGGMGWVYKASHALTSRVVALKVLREDQLTQDHSIDRMMREATILASVAHPGIPTFYECGLLEDGRPWIAMELISGAPLDARMSRSVMEAAEVIELVEAVADVLDAAHTRGVTHRDLKPDNIFLTPDDPHHPVRVIDWGIAHRLEGSRFTNMNEAIGTPTYMAPEQARGGPTDGYCDVYGLGVVAYQALTGRPPFMGGSGVEILVQHLSRPVPALAPRCPDAPYGLVELVERMLAKSFEDRPDAAEVKSTLAKLRETAHEPTYLYFTLEDGDGVPLPIVEGNHTPVTAGLRAPRCRYDDDDEL